MDYCPPSLDVKRHLRTAPFEVTMVVLQAMEQYQYFRPDVGMIFLPLIA